MIVIPALHTAAILIFLLKLVRTVKLNIFPYRKIIYITYILHNIPLKNAKKSLCPLTCSISYSLNRNVTAIHTETENFRTYNCESC